LVCTAFHGPKPSPLHTAEHIDRNPSNNRPDNLCWFTPAEQIQASYRNNPNRKSSAPQRSLAVLGRKKDSDDDWIEYLSCNDAARQLHLNVGSVSAVAKKVQRHTGGYEFVYVAQPDLEGEEWVKLTVNQKEIQVSNLGRFMDTRGKKKTVAPSRDGYCRVNVNRKQFLLNRLVCEAFWGPPPQAGMEAHHKNSNRSDNHKDNLQWLTKRAHAKLTNSRNKKTRRSNAPKQSKPVYGRKYGSDDEWTEFPSMAEAARQLNLNSGSISAVTRGRLKRTGNFEFKLKPQE
jgi:hypothetical protein